MFGREWKSTTDSVTFYLDTIPEKIRIVQGLKQIEVQSQKLVVQEMEVKKDEGHMITHVSDSTARRGVGQFIGQGST